MDDFAYLSSPIHLNRFKSDRIKVGVNEESGEDEFESLDLESDRFKHLQESLLISIDGTIMAVEKARVRGFLSEPEVRGFRLGTVKFPREYEIKNEDDFFRLLAIMCPLDEI